jgi:hypothetical protein
VLDEGKTNAFAVLVGRWYLLLAGILSGACVGGLIFAASQLNGLLLFVVVGGALGILVAAIYALTAGSVQLKEVQIGVPMNAQATFSIGQKDREVAWRLFVETTSHISTQRLEAHEGILREALDSLYGLFTSTRTLLTAEAPSLPSQHMTVEELALSMLNIELRPFLSKWHPLLTEFEAKNEGIPEREWEHDAAFRTDLEVLRQRLVGYAKAFGELGGVSEVDRLIASSIRGD